MEVELIGMLRLSVTSFYVHDVKLREKLKNQLNTRSHQFPAPFHTFSSFCNGVFSSSLFFRAGNWQRLVCFHYLVENLADKWKINLH